MAKRRKKTTHRRHHTRRRMGAVHSGAQNEVMETAGLVIGGVAATIIQRVAGNINPKIVAAGQIFVGLYAKNHATSPLMRGAGYGIMSAGAIHLTHDLGLIKGIEDGINGLYSGGMQQFVNGEQNVSGMSNGYMVSGISNNSSVSGMEDVQHQPISWAM